MPQVLLPWVQVTQAAKRTHDLTPCSPNVVTSGSEWAGPVERAGLWEGTGQNVEKREEQGENIRKGGTKGRKKKLSRECNGRHIQTHCPPPHDRITQLSQIVAGDFPVEIGSARISVLMIDCGFIIRAPVTL
jgi:hypothetical protein